MQIALDMMPARRVNVDMDVVKYAMAIPQHGDRIASQLSNRYFQKH